MQASRPRALVVDDDAALRMLVRVNLELDGFDVLEASTIEEAGDAARDGAIDVALLDVHLAGCDTHSLRARLQAAGIPVALVTGSVDVDEYRDEADGVLTKPFDPQTLVELARRLARVEV
jgi:DNA-binding response OmpR family regulator